MSTLTSKTSSQHFFLRTLKAIIHLREAARAAAEKARKQGNTFPLVHFNGASGYDQKVWSRLQCWKHTLNLYVLYINTVPSTH